LEVAKSNAKLALEFLQKYEGVFDALGIYAGLVAGFSALLAIGAPSLAIVAGFAAVISAAFAIGTIVSQVSTGQLTILQGLSLAGANLGSVGAGAGLSRAIRAAAASNGRGRNAATILGYMANANFSMVSSFVPTILGWIRR